MQMPANSAGSAGETDQILSPAGETAEHCQLQEESVFPSCLTDDEEIDIAAARILKRFRPAFEELAK